MGGIMSSLTLNGDISGSVILAAPSVAGSTTLTLPTTSGTVITTGNIPAGTIIQVVSSTTTTRTSTTSTTYVNATDIAATITPKSATSKILVQCNVFGGCDASYSMWLGLNRNGSSILTPAAVLYIPNSYGVASASFSYLDSPASSSALTYQVTVKTDNSGANVVAGGPKNNAYGSGTALCNNTVTLLEVAQ